MTRVAILVGERDEPVGRAQVPETAFVIRHQGDYYVRTPEGVRLSKTGSGLGIVFRITEVYVRERLEPA